MLGRKIAVPTSTFRIVRYLQSFLNVLSKSLSFCAGKDFGQVRGEEKKLFHVSYGFINYGIDGDISKPSIDKKHLDVVIVGGGFSGELSHMKKKNFVFPSFELIKCCLSHNLCKETTRFWT